jgi:hypothetical protein
MPPQKARRPPTMKQRDTVDVSNIVVGARKRVPSTRALEAKADQPSGNNASKQDGLRLSPIPESDEYILSSHDEPEKLGEEDRLDRECDRVASDDMMSTDEVMSANGKRKKVSKLQNQKSNSKDTVTSRCLVSIMFVWN